MSAQTFSRLRRQLRDLPANETSRLLCRAEVQIAFARMLATLQDKTTAANWNKAIAKAEAIVAAAGNLDQLKKAVTDAEMEMAAIGKVAKQFTVHCVGHGHIDMNWMWSWPETVSCTHDTFASVLALMDQYPDVTYSQSQASVYALVEKHFPEMFERIKKRVKEGRWEVTAVHWVEGDKNIASGESLCRHLLHTRRFFEDKFGLGAEDVPIDWEPDTFGHANTLPSFLARAGVKYYYCCRPGGGCEHTMVGEERPPIFWWQAPDGSRVLVNQEKTWYNSDTHLGDNVAAPIVDFHRKTGLKDWMNVYGIGNHGGGPTRAEIAYYKFMQDWPVYPNVEFGTVKGFMDKVESDVAKGKLKIPVLDHELNFEFTGCYTSQSLIKQANRFGENYLLEAETMGTLAWKTTGLSFQKDLMREGWIDTLFNHFHDILPGSGVRETRERALGMFQGVGAITGAIKRRAGSALTARLDTASLLPETPDGNEELKHVEAGDANAYWEAGPGNGALLTGLSRTSTGGKRFFPFVVYNHCSWPRTEPVTVSLYDTDLDPSRVVALDEKGVAHPTLFLGQNNYWGHEEKRFLFTPGDVPATGYRTYLLCEGTPEPSENEAVVKGNEWFETPLLRVRFDRFRSGILEIHDRRTGWSYAGDGADTFGALKFLKERPRGMTAWVLGHETEEPVDLLAGPYRVIGGAHDWSGVPTGGGEAVVVERDLVVPGTKSKAKLRALLHALQPRIDFTLELDWREIGEPDAVPTLRLRIPLVGEQLQGLYETAFGSVERGPMGGEEVPALRYAHVRPVPSRSVTAFGSLTLLQDCKYGHTLHDGDDPALTLTIVRSSTDPDHAPEVARTTIRYSIVLHDKAASPAELTRLGAEFNHPLIVLPAAMQKGSEATVKGFAEVLTPNVVLTALKPAESGSALILRLVELNGIETDAHVKLAPELIAGLKKCGTVDLLERPTSGAAKLARDSVTVHMPAHGIVTLRLS